MENNKRHCPLWGLFLAILLLAGNAYAQEEADSVMLTGVVVNNDTRRPYPNCTLRFVQEGQTVAEAVSDAEGNFAIPVLAVGSYELHVKIKNFTIHQADLTLDANADLTVAVDTVMFRTLRAVTVTAAKHMLGTLQITSRHDKRLWGLTAGYRDANASVALPPDAHGNLDTGATDGLVFPLEMPWRVQMAYMTGKLGTRLRTPPIWELVPDRKYVADSTRSEK